MTDSSNLSAFTSRSVVVQPPAVPFVYGQEELHATDVYNPQGLAVSPTSSTFGAGYNTYFGLNATSFQDVGTLFTNRPYTNTHQKVSICVRDMYLG